MREAHLCAKIIGSRFFEDMFGYLLGNEGGHGSFGDVEISKEITSKLGRGSTKLEITLETIATDAQQDACYRKFGL